MPVDPDLLATAKLAGDRFALAEREADQARAEYYQAVRRLHLAGASLRDVAQALGVSHQRVQQIVQANGGTWWSRIWRDRKIRPDMSCSFCGRSDAQVTKLIAGPKVYICDACVGSAEQVVRSDRPGESQSVPSMDLAPVGGRTRCSFCRQRSRRVEIVIRQKKVRTDVPDDVAAYMLAHSGQAPSRVELKIVRAGEKAVCARCLDICRRILDDRSHAA